MTHPLTPREKVARLIWGRFAPSCDMDEENAMRGEYREIADAILTALASGSGDHAELARLAVVATDAASLGDGLQEAALTRFQAHANPATVLALLAENAALRAERDEWRDTAFKARSANTEAERKLAEAVGLLRPFSEAAENLDDETRDNDHIWEQPAAMSIDAGHLRAARTFLSKEAECG